MKRNDVYFEQALNAFVDQELDPAERIALHARLEADEGLADEVCRIRAVKALVHDAYESVPEPPARGSGAPVSPRLPWPRAVAAALCFLVGGAVGWTLQQGTERAPDAAALPAHSAAIADLSALETVTAQHTPVLLHLSSADPEKMRMALDELEALAKSDHGHTIELVVNGGGLDLIRQGGSELSERAEQLLSTYGNITILACSKALERWRYRQGHAARLLKGVQVAPSALDLVIQRLKAGWTYVRI